MQLKLLLEVSLILHFVSLKHTGAISDFDPLTGAHLGWEWGARLNIQRKGEVGQDDGNVIGDGSSGQLDKQRDRIAPDPNRTLLHPLDPLTEHEINATTAIIKNFRQGDWIFNYITLKEPEKSTLLPYFLRGRDPPPLSVPRRAFVVLLDRLTGETEEVVVNLDHGQVESWNEAPSGVHPPFLPEELDEAERIVREDAEVRQRSRDLGWNDISLVNCDPWSIGYIGDRPELEGRRLIQLYLYGKNHPTDNQYTHPFDFLVIVDLLQKRVVAIEDLPTHHKDFRGSNPEGNVVPRAESNYDPDLRDPDSFRNDLNPVNVSQRGGPSFVVNGNEISWQKFKMRVGFNGREGLVLHHVNYNDGGNVRPLFYRMSLAEMMVPYGDPRPPYHRKHVFDSGQYGIGFSAVELRPQVDCIGEVRMLDASLHNEHGESQRRPNMICVHEEDAGLLWKHVDYRTGRATSQRSQRLVLMFVATVGNYDYIYRWHFHQDGSIEFNVKLTGILSVNLLASNGTPAGHGTVVFPQVNAQYHQHFFTLRVDPEIDGNRNTVVVQDAVPLQEPTGSARNPYGQGFTVRRSVLKTAASARTNISPETSRVWLIRNQNSMNPYTKEPVGWKLMPWPSPPTLFRRDSPIHDQAEFLDYSTWVTPYEEDQLFPGGFYLNNSGLPEWVGRNRNANIENEDIVLWHNFGLTHIPITENFPIMAVETCSIMLKPANFFNENPTLDIPPVRPNRDKDEL